MGLERGQGLMLGKGVLGGHGWRDASGCCGRVCINNATGILISCGRPLITAQGQGFFGVGLVGIACVFLWGRMFRGLLGRKRRMV